jgi:hypothetical protein
MPAFVIASSRPDGTGKLDAVICSPLDGYGPDRKSAVPVQIECINDQVLAVDGQPHEIMSTSGGNGTITYLIEFNMQRLRNRTQRLALAQAKAQLQRFRDVVAPIIAENEHPQRAREGLRLLTAWLDEENERLSGIRPLDR